MNISQLGRAAIQVRDLAASERFYVHVLNMPVIERREACGELKLGVGESSWLSIRATDANSRARGSSEPQIAFIVGNTPASLDAAARRLEAHAVQYERAASAEFESLYLRDPDDHLIELYYWPSW